MNQTVPSPTIWVHGMSFQSASLVAPESARSCLHHFISHPAKEESIGLVEVLRRITMQVFVREHCTMIAAPVQCDIDGIPKGPHYGEVDSKALAGAPSIIGPIPGLVSGRAGFLGYGVLSSCISGFVGPLCFQSVRSRTERPGLRHLHAPRMRIAGMASRNLLRRAGYYCWSNIRSRSAEAISQSLWKCTFASVQLLEGRLQRSQLWPRRTGTQGSIIRRGVRSRCRRGWRAWPESGR